MDDEILAGLMDHNPEGLELLKSRYGPLLHYVISGIIQDERDVEECLSDIYLKVWNNIASFDAQRSKLSSWLTIIARNSAIDIRRKVRGEDTLDDENISDGSDPEKEMLKREQRENLSRVLMELEPAERRLIYRKYYYLQSTSQIAAELGVTERTIEGRLYRLRKKLKKRLGGEFFE
jgi:RNA polymerase sigma-70 factor (ECF subfamily)